MLPRTNRLVMQDHFRPDVSFSTDSFFLKAKRNNQRQNRFAFVVSKRVDKKAVVRNQSKRIIRSCIEDLWQRIVPGYDMLFILKKRLSKEDKQNACMQVSSILTKGHMLKPV